MYMCLKCVVKAMDAISIVLIIPGFLLGMVSCVLADFGLERGWWEYGEVY